MEEILSEVLAELTSAELKHPSWPKDIIHAAAIVNEESGELTRAALQVSYENGSMDEVRKEAVQTAAMCIRFLKNLDEGKLYANKL